GSLLLSAWLFGPAPYRPVTRAGAKIGDDVYVTATIGDAALALKLLTSKSPQPERGPAAYLFARHHRPAPKVAAGTLLARERLATAMIDVSDGLLQALGRICKVSKSGAVLWGEKLPRSTPYRAL